MSVGTMETCNTVQTWSQPMRIMKEHLISCAVVPGNAYPHEHLLETKPFSLPDGESAMALTPAQPVDPLCRAGLYRGQHIHERVFLSQGGPKTGRSTVQCVCFFEAVWPRLQRAPENALKMLFVRLTVLERWNSHCLPSISRRQMTTLSDKWCRLCAVSAYEQIYTHCSYDRQAWTWLIGWMGHVKEGGCLLPLCVCFPQS